VDGLRKWVDNELRIHATLTQHVTVSGRLSSVEPNLQNIPRPSEDVFSLRSAFMPKQDHVLLVIDYEQLEMRLLAHMADDKNMIDVINRGWDIHAGTASLMFGHKYDDIQAALKRKKLAAKEGSNVVLSKLEKQMCFDRQAGKNIGFGINYGEGPRALAAKLGVSVDEAKRLKAKYFEPYPSIKQFIDDVHSAMAHEGLVETIMGRPRRFPEMLELGHIPYWQLRGSEKAAKARAERQGVNSVIQGSAADVAKLAMLKCEFDERLANLGVEQLLQVHDELIFEVPEETLHEATPIIVDNMEHPFDFDLSIPLDVDSGHGYSWASAKA
jgi:DNA polymerase-1